MHNVRVCGPFFDGGGVSKLQLNCLEAGCSLVTQLP
jgi:hypothetical protein